ILDKYGVSDLLEEANYDELENNKYDNDDSGQDENSDRNEEYRDYSNGKSGNTSSEKADSQYDGKENNEESQQNNVEVEDVTNDRRRMEVLDTENEGYSEEEAIKNIIVERINQDEDLDELINEYQRILVRNLNQNSITAKIKDTVIGSSVI